MYNGRNRIKGKMFALPSIFKSTVFCEPCFPDEQVDISVENLHVCLGDSIACFRWTVSASSDFLDDTIRRENHLENPYIEKNLKSDLFVFVSLC